MGPVTTHEGHVIDTTPSTGGNHTSTILAEVCKIVPTPDPSGNGYYEVQAFAPQTVVIIGAAQRDHTDSTFTRISPAHGQQDKNR